MLTLTSGYSGGSQLHCSCVFFFSLQVVEPDASKKDAYEAAFQRHYQIGKQIFEP